MQEVKQSMSPVGEKRPRTTSNYQHQHPQRGTDGVSSVYHPRSDSVFPGGADENDANDDKDDSDDNSLAPVHAMKRLKVDDDHGDHGDCDQDHAMEETNGDHGSTIEEDDERSSLASVSSVESTPPPAPNHRESTAHLSLDDLPLTPKLNNCTHRKAAMNRLFLPDALVQSLPSLPSDNNHNHNTNNIPQSNMNAYLGRLHHERRQHQFSHPSAASTSLTHRMDALCLESSSSASSSSHHHHPLWLPTLSTTTNRRRSLQIQLQTDSKLE
jgi:hypothetical protein